MATVLICVSTFMGFYLPSVSAQAGDVGGQYALDSETFDTSCGFINSDGEIFYPDEKVDNVLIFNREIKIYVLERTDGTFNLVVEEYPKNSSSSYSHSWIDIQSESDLTVDYYVFDSYAKDLENKKKDFYVSFDKFFSRDSPNSKFIDVVNVMNGRTSTREVGIVSGEISYGAKPYSTQMGFKEVVFGLIGFNIPLVPEPINSIVSSMFLFSMAFVIFATLLKIAPMVG